MNVGGGGGQLKLIAALNRSCTIISILPKCRSTVVPGRYSSSTFVDRCLTGTRDRLHVLTKHCLVVSVPRSSDLSRH
jgi:hypothetical protein